MKSQFQYNTHVFFNVFDIADVYIIIEPKSSEQPEVFWRNKILC